MKPLNLAGAPRREQRAEGTSLSLAGGEARTITMAISEAAVVGAFHGNNFTISDDAMASQCASLAYEYGYDAPGLSDAYDIFIMNR